VKDRVIAESSHALRLEEKGYPPVYYIPRDDVDMSLLARTAHYTYCPYKAIALTTAFPWVAQNRSSLSGHTKNRMRQSPESRIIWRSIPHESMPSK